MEDHETPGGPDELFEGDDKAADIALRLVCLKEKRRESLSGANPGLLSESLRHFRW